MDSDRQGEDDRTVVPALRSLDPLTGPTADERARMRARILAALDTADADSPEVAEGRPAIPAQQSSTRELGVAPARPAEPAMQSTAEPDTADEPAAEVAGVADASQPAGAATAGGAVAEAGGDVAGRRRPGSADAEAERVAVAGGGVAEAGDAAEARAGAENRPGRTSTRSGGRGRAGAAGRGRVGGPPRPAGPGRDPRTADRETRRPGQRRDDERPRGFLAGVRGRFAVAAVAVLALVGALAGMSLLLARDALPGDTLYGVKRTGEAASLGLTFGDEPKAFKHLEFAAARVTEIETLARRYPQPGDAPVGGYLTALTDFDNDAAAGARQLIALATGTDGQLLLSLRDWATQQTSRLNRVVSRLPEAARVRQGASIALLDKITTRSEALYQRMDCFQITSGSFDDIGALPATGACAQNPGIDPSPSSSATPSVPQGADNSPLPPGSDRADVPLVPQSSTPAVPPVPVPGETVSVPAPTTRPGEPTSTPGPTPTQPPLIQLPPLLPGLPGLRVG